MADASSGPPNAFGATAPTLTATLERWVASLLWCWASTVASLRETAKQRSLQAQRSRDSRREVHTKDTLSSDAFCSVPRHGVEAPCSVRLRGDLLLIRRHETARREADGEAILAEGSAEVLELNLSGAAVRCHGSLVILSRNQASWVTMTLDTDAKASLWAEKLALACGHSESIAKLLSMQRHRILTLEQHSQETSLNSEEVERCLNFLSREYVAMRYQVRRAESEEKLPEDEAVREGGALVAERSPPVIEGLGRRRHDSEPEKEPRVETITEEKQTKPPPTRAQWQPRSPCLLGSPKMTSPKTKGLSTGLSKTTPTASSKRSLDGTATKSAKFHQASIEGLDRRGHKLALAHQRTAPPPHTATTAPLASARAKEGTSRSVRQHPWQR